MKVEANRQNSLRSTGPKTLEGKLAVRRNALKHGILARCWIIPDEEDRSDFDTLLTQLVEELKPGDTLERLLVEEIAISIWRLRRVARCETGEIRKARDAAIHSAVSSELQTMDLAELVDGDFKKSTEKKADLVSGLGLVQKSLAEIESKEHLSEESKRLLLSRFPDDNDIIQLVVGEFGLAPDIRVKESIQEVLFRKAQFLEQCIAAASGDKKMNLQAEVAASNLPSREALDKILRYETTIKRQLYRAMNQLERLQRRRQGEHVPPPLSVDLGGGQ